MKLKLKTLLPMLVLGTGIVSATPLTETATFNAVLDQESNGLHVTVTGQFTYLTVPNGSVVNLDQVTDLTADFQEYLAYNYSAPGTDTVVGLSAVQDFLFDPATDLLTASITVIPNDPASGVFKIAPADANELAMLQLTGPEVASLGMAVGNADPYQVFDGTAPEPTSWALMGLGLVGVWGLRRRATL